MQLQEARSIDCFYDAVAEYDISITAYPRLSLALDGRVTEPRIGRVAATAHSHATGEMVPIDRRELFFTLMSETSLNPKQADRALEHCLHCWDWTGDIENVLTYEEFDTPAMRQAVETLRETDSSYRTLTDTRLSAETKAAVLGEEFVTPLDLSLLPDGYDRISLFTGEDEQFPPIDIFPTARAVVDAVVENVTVDSAQNTAVVVDLSTIYAPLLEAAFDVADIPYHHSDEFVDNDRVRAFLRLLRLANGGSDIRVRDVQPSLERFGFDIDTRDRERRLDLVTGAPYQGLKRVYDTARTGTLQEILSTFESWSGWTCETLHNELEELQLTDKAVTDQHVSQLQFYLSSFDVPIREAEDSEGVLILDCSSTTYVDRYTVFYLGLGTGWARSPPDVPWIDDSTFVARDLDRFQLLLQNGQQRHYLVQETRSGTTVRPCPYFFELADEHIESFRDFSTSHVWETPRSGGTHEPFPSPDPASVSIETVSQSTLTRLVNCPREEYFYRLLETRSSFALARGTAVHEAAEIYVAEPAIYEDRYDEIVQSICDRLEVFVPPARVPIVRTDVELALEALELYIDANPPIEHEPVGYEDDERVNRLAEDLDIELESEVTERTFKRERLGLNGVVDLLRTNTCLVDYKTGSPDSANDLRRASSLDPLSDEPNFQAPAYLAQHRRSAPDSELSMQFVYLTAIADELLTDSDVEMSDLVTTLTYLPETFSEFTTRREVYDEITDYADSNNQVKALEPLGYERYREFFEEHELPPKETDPERREEIIQRFIEYTKDHFKDTKYVERGCRAAVDDIDSVLGNYYLRSDIDAFEEFVCTRINELESYHETGFPVQGPEGMDPNWDYVDNRDLVIDDE